MAQTTRAIKAKSSKAPVTMPVLALRGLVLFPNMVLHFDVAREKSMHALNEAMQKDRQIFLVTQREIEDDAPDFKDLYKVGVVAEIRQIVRAQGESLRVVVEGKYRAKLAELTQETPYFSGLVTEYPMRSRVADKALCDAMMRTVKELFEEYCSLTPKMPRELVTTLMVSEDAGFVAEFIAGNVQLRYEDKQDVLEQSSVTRRLEMLAHILESENEILSLEHDIHDKVREQMDRNQREYYLREQLKIISSELGDGSETTFEDIENYRERILALGLPEKSEEKLLSELQRMNRMSSSSQEAAVLRGYLDIVLELPWKNTTADKLDIDKARKLLEDQHYGLRKVKERILESLAVRKLAPDIKGQIICLLGPPGVGKTSIARSIAEAMGRNYVRLSLGGVRDESDIRGHRKTYIAAMPGRIITAMKQAGSRNPLMLLDEVDKLSSDFRGDPSSALLEVLDSEQNNAFRDHFIEIPFDLSQVFFIATANSRETIPAPLLDRMEIIELGSYTREEKFQIMKRHLLVKQLGRHGLAAKQLSVANGALYDIVDYYTREAGVRGAERQLATICRKAAVRLVGKEPPKKVSVTTKNLEELLGPRKFKDDETGKVDQIGVANGLAWTSVGGEMLQVEAAVMDGGAGKHQSTGSLGDVMKESVAAAITYIRGVAGQYNIDPGFYKDKDIHIHFPEGAVPKDGPSAGITTCTALVSALSGIPVRHEVAMTGEITLRGRVLPIGGLREKTMAAYKQGITTVIIPAANLPDLQEVEQIVRDHIRFIPAERMETVLEAALTHLPATAEPVQGALLPPEKHTGAALRQ